MTLVGETETGSLYVKKEPEKRKGKIKKRTLGSGRSRVAKKCRRGLHGSKGRDMVRTPPPVIPP